MSKTVFWFRHILAICHFNENLKRDERTTEAGEVQIKVVYPKFKNGEATVRSVRVFPKYVYVDEIYQTMLNAGEEKLEEATQELVKMAPPPMDRMLVKQSREEAIQKMSQRKEMVVANVPPTAAPMQNPPLLKEARAKPCCRTCGQPMKGHNKVQNCPRNQK